MSKYFFFLLFIGLLGLTSCNNTDQPETSKDQTSAQASAAPAGDYSKYELTQLPGTSMQKAVLRNQAGRVIEQGYLDDKGLKTGEWLSFYENSGLPYKLINYRAGVQNGLYIFFNEIGQVSLLATYADNQLDGYWVKYRFGRLDEEAEYLKGQMHGTHRQYFVREGWLQFTTEYKNGVRHGMSRTYNKEGQVTLEYEFKDGEKISGGMK